MFNHMNILMPLFLMHSLEQHLQAMNSCYIAVILLQEARQATRGLQQMQSNPPQAPQSAEPGVILHGALTQTVNGGLDYERPVQINFEEPPRQRMGWLGRCVFGGVGVGVDAPTRVGVCVCACMCSACA